jgi:peptide/nickel transport system substrate-binding protein
MKCPRPFNYLNFSDGTLLDITDKLLISFTLPEPDGHALEKLSVFFQIAPTFLKTNVFSETTYGYFPKAGPWGTGPFKLIEGNIRYGKPSTKLVLEAYEGYWDSRYPKVQKIIFDNTLIRNREEAMRLCMETEGVVDIVNFVRPLDTLKVAESPYAQILKTKEPGLLWGVFNQRKKDSKWRDIRLKKAVNYAINRQELQKYAAKGNVYNLGGYIPSAAYGHNPGLVLYSYDTEKAKTLLAAAGYEDSFELNIITAEAWGVEAQIISKMLERIGLKVTLDILTFPGVMKRFYHPILDKPPEEQTWDIMIAYSTGMGRSPSASGFVHFFRNESEQRWIEVNPVVDEMWKEMLKTIDSQEREEKVRRMVRYIYDQAYSPFIYTPLKLYAANREVKLVPYQGMGLVLKETSVTENHWSLRGQNN